MPAFLVHWVLIVGRTHERERSGTADLEVVGVVSRQGPCNVPILRVGRRVGRNHASLVLLAYIAVLGAASFWLFQRRDITGAKGE